MASFTTAIIITGPTAVGKTDLALELAKRTPAEIVSADSRQIYRYMDIGTAKPTLTERQSVPHHLIDICNPDEHYSAGRFGREARSVVQEIFERGKLPIVVGGSGFYLKALLEGFSELLPSDRSKRKELKRRIKEEGNEVLHAELARVDPESAKRLHPNDTQRIVRALEVYYSEGRPLSELQQASAEPAPFAYQIFCLNLERKMLHSRIHQRVLRMVEAGLVEECEALLERGYSSELNALQTVGYQETFQYLAGRISRQSMIEHIQNHTRQYAKRQITWCRRIPQCVWIESKTKTDINEQIQIIESVVSLNDSYLRRY